MLEFSFLSSEKDWRDFVLEVNYLCLVSIGFCPSPRVFIVFGDLCEMGKIKVILLVGN